MQILRQCPIMHILQFNYYLSSKVSVAPTLLIEGAVRPCAEGMYKSVLQTNLDYTTNGFEP
jgi:hypothetical protein